MPFLEEELNRLRDYSKSMMGGRGVVGGTITTEHPRQEPKGTLMKALDFVTRPLYASAGFSNAIVKGQNIESAFKAAIRGIKGEERTFYSDVLKSAGVKNKYVRAVAGLALDIGLDPITWMTFGAGVGAKLGLTTLNKSGKALLKQTLKSQLPKVTQKQMATTANRKIAAQLAREEIEEAILRTAMKNPQQYISQSAVRIFGKEIPVVSDIYKMVKRPVGKVIAPAKEKFYRVKPVKWLGESFIGDKFIIKHAKGLTPLQKNLTELYRQQTRARIMLGGDLAMEKSIQMAREIPKVADRELIANAIEQAAKKKVTLESLLPQRLAGTARNVEKFIYKEITEPEAQKGLLASFKKGYVPHYYRKKLAGMLSKDIPSPIVARNRAGRMRIFDTLEQSQKAGWEPIEDFAVSVGIRNAYSKRIIAVDDYVQKMLSTTATPISRKSVEWKTMLKANRLPEGMGLYIPRGGARFYPLYNSTKKKAVQVGNAKAIRQLFKAEGLHPSSAFMGGELLKDLRLTPVKTAFKVSDDIPVYLLPREIADMMNAVSPYMTREKNLVDFMRLSDGVMNFWKASVTSWWPGFHARNAMSNIWLGFLGGLKNPVRFVEAMKVQRYGYLVRKGKVPKDFIVKLGDQSFKASELYTMGRETAVLGRGWFGAELGRSIEKEIAMKYGRSPRLTGFAKGKELARNIVLEKPRAAGTAVENNARLALFFDQIAKGFDVGTAARHTKKFLFDYGELTRFEKRVMKRLVPFYTWVRKNIPLEIEMLFKQPGKFAAVKKTKEEFESLSERPDEKYLPEWMREKEVFVRLPWESKDKPLYMNFDFAFQDLARLNLTKPDVLREWYGYLRPDLKAITEILTNYNVFFGRNIVDPNLPEEVKFRKILKEELLSNMRITGYYRRMTKEDVGMVPKILDFVLGLKPYPYDEAQSRYWYYQRKETERRALRKEQLKKKK